MNPLGRKTPLDWKHVELYPAAPDLQGSVVFGINWYEGFDNPVKGSDGRFRIKIAGNVRGGHCICSDKSVSPDAWAWHQFYDQGDEGACTGFGTSRALTLHTGRTFDAFWVYDDARRIEHTYPEGEGAYVRDAFKAQQQWGAHYESGPHCVRTPWHFGAPGVRLASYHWVTTAQQVQTALGTTEQEIPLLNSWGTSYPETVYVSLEDVERLLKEEGEAGIPVFRK